MAATVHLLRHAAHDRVDRILCGRMAGVALGEAGRAQAARLAARLAPLGLAAIRTSPMQRCRETAEAIGRITALAPGVDEAFNEIDFGDWTGRSFTALDDDPQWHFWNTQRDQAAPPGGEAMRAAQARAVAGIAALLPRHAGQAVAVVSHSDIIKAILAHYLGAPLQSYERFEIGPASLTTLAIWPGGGKVLAMNDLAHDISCQGRHGSGDAT
ncbi:histidine phosphatase family protein [Roseomonas sp. E05]|uniref:histidine phosphatase family protein n=1 Tax=Roseomonas sp. E05 TaxID=3046310 RepID=UPI0024BB421C|nr:histidine phosphatase family protein [Roseomonas sp. E05]MDJ0389977.1 histidine phosphatase family protein [Roseomonas sp. E05]